MRYRFVTTDVFTDRRFGGNPLAVLPDARGLDTAAMQAIAREFNLSETTFVLPADDPSHTCRVRIFTPAREMAFAGHPTVGTAYVLVRTGIVPLPAAGTALVLEEGVGPVPVTITTRDGAAVGACLTAARLPERGPTPPPVAELAAALSLEVADIVVDGRDAPQGASCGAPYLIVPVAGRGALARAAVEPATWRRVIQGWWADAVYVVCRDPETDQADLRARMFAPDHGVVEDPATGSAAAALAGYLAARDGRGDGTHRWIVEQGFEMGRPSVITIEVDTEGGAVRAVRVAGECVMVSEGSIEV